VHLGLEPGIHSPLLDHQQSLRQVATSVSSTPHHPDAAYSDSATPYSVAAADQAADAEAGGGYTPTAAAAAAASSAAVDAGGFKRGQWGKNDVLYGIINAIVGIPTMISFAAIVYQVSVFSLFCAVLYCAMFCLQVTLYEDELM
jgi:hypothetical protein